MAGSNAKEETSITCECKAGDIIILPCSGGSNCMQIANQVALSLDTMAAWGLYYLAGIGSHVDGIVESAR